MTKKKKATRPSGKFAAIGSLNKVARKALEHGSAKKSNDIDLDREYGIWLSSLKPSINEARSRNARARAVSGKRIFN